MRFEQLFKIFYLQKYVDSHFNYNVNAFLITWPKPYLGTGVCWNNCLFKNWRISWMSLFLLFLFKIIFEHNQKWLIKKAYEGNDVGKT